MGNLQKLLSEINFILNKENERKAEKRANGDDFNIFPILRKSHDEEHLHSAFLAELLNPKGSHGQKDVFLKAFLKVCLPDYNENTITEDTKVYTERYIGQINEDKTEGGCLDVLIENNTSAIVLENKIYAQDQKNQLLRYSNFANKNFAGKFQIIYLTLDGKPASSESIGTTKFEYIRLSYKEHIVSWLNDCIKLADNKPSIRETITQYLNLIKKLTGQDMDEKEKEALIALLLDSESNIRVAFSIEQNLWKVKRKILCRIEQFQNEIMSEINSEGIYTIEKIDYNGKYEQTESGYSFYIKNWKNHYIKFSFADKWYNGLYYGIVANKGEENLSVDQKQSLIASLDNYKGYNNNWWSCYKIPENDLYSSAWNGDTFVDIATTDNFKQLMKTELLILLATTRDLDM